jgi:hypothetical protein
MCHLTFLVVDFSTTPSNSRPLAIVKQRESMELSDERGGSEWALVWCCVMRQRRLSHPQCHFFDLFIINSASSLSIFSTAGRASFRLDGEPCCRAGSLREGFGEIASFLERYHRYALGDMESSSLQLTWSSFLYIRIIAFICDCTDKVGVVE